ncbi:histidine phosphatase family protein [Pantoea sp. Cy-639]|uniref:histidine phosphatase family protein n=1 Tax=Pantoea sp. Cy-639 TaxID=2608360 RepID=UPI00141E5996|nr:histidine phosphatase family protein [Pantoea sp. Cy-639]NIF16576.1 histidine phosphatase family protein [Pantoea sp. Cy-639]
MKPIQLTLVCHGLTEAQRVGRFALDDEPLRDPADVPGRVFGAAHCLSAPERRARQTADGLSARVDEGLRDADFGNWKGMPLKRLDQQALQAWLSDPHATPHGGESIAALCLRVGHWMDTALGEGDWVGITHPFVIRAAMLHALGAPLEVFHRIDVSPLARVCFSRYGKWRMQVG